MYENLIQRNGVRRDEDGYRPCNHPMRTIIHHSLQNCKSFFKICKKNFSNFIFDKSFRVILNFVGWF